MSVRSEARRHRDEVGDVVAEYWDKPTRLTVGVFVGSWLFLSGLTFFHPGETVLLAVSPTIVFGILLAVFLLYWGNERLVVCERGLLIGSFAPGLRPYVIRYDQIVPGSVVPVTRARRYAKETEQGELPFSTVRITPWSRQAVYLVGPSPRDARRHRAKFAQTLDPPPLTFDGRWTWFTGIGPTPPEQVTARIAQAASAAGAVQLAQATAAATVRELTGNPADAPRQLPGFPVIPDLRGREVRR